MVLMVATLVLVVVSLGLGVWVEIGTRRNARLVAQARRRLERRSR
jgi:hypothetical protein